ncbi:MAG: hypothetical protein WD794_03865 [Mycobacteriales bacterium]
MTGGADGTAGEATAPAGQGTPVPVDVSPDPGIRLLVAVLLAGPVLSSIHFLVVYLAVEAGCTGDGAGLDVVTLVATAVAALACLVSAGWAYRRWRADSGAAGSHAGPVASSGGLTDRRPLAFVGFLLSLLGVTLVLFVGLPALVLPACGP